jgi:hypothetical protein
MLTNYKLKKYSENLENILNNASENSINSGLNWYDDFYLWSESLAKKYNYNTFVIAQVFSALSPRNKLEKNKIDTISVLNAIKNNLTPEQIKVSTFHNNKNKAFDIAKGLKQITKDSLKTYSFCKNVGELNSNFVTIDVWQLRALSLKKENKTPTKLEYLQLVDLHQKIAQKNNILGYQLQAITWEELRNNYKKYLN